MVEGYEELTREHFFYFVACCRVWADFFQLGDCEIRYQFVEADENDPRATMVPADIGNRLFQIVLYDSWDMAPNDENLWKTAFHEVLEVLTSDVHAAAYARDWNLERYDREHHRIIRILERAVFHGMWKDGHRIFNFQPTTEGGKISVPEIPELDNNESMHGTGVQRDEQESGGCANSVSPLQGSEKRGYIAKATGLPHYSPMR